MAKTYEMLYKLNAQLGSGFSSAFQEAQKALEDVQNAMQELNSLQSDISAYQKQQSAVETLQDKLELLQKKLQNVSTEMEESGTFSSSLANKQATLQTQINQTARKLETEQQKLDEMGEALEDAGIDTSDLASESKKLEAELDDLTDQGKEAAAQVEDLGTQTDSTTSMLNSMATVITSAGILSGLKELASAAAECVSAFAEFEAEMSYVEALSGASGSELDELTEKAQELGATTSFTAEEAAEALSYMALAGYDTEEMLSSVDGVLNLAAAAAMDLGTASDIVTDYLTAFGLSAEDSADFVDQLAYAMSNSNTTVEQLGEAYKNVAATSTQLGFSLEDTTAALMVMADAGVKGGEAGTALASIMTRVANNTSGATDMLAAYGIEVYDSEGNMNDLSDILGGLQDVWGGLTDEQKANLAYTVAGKTAQSELMTVLGESTGSFEEYAEGLSSCTGAAEEMADVMLDNLSGSMTLLDSAVDGLKIAFGEALAPAIEVVVEILANVVSKITDFVSEHQALIAGLTTAVALFGAVVVAITAFNAITTIATTVATLFGAGLTAMLGPIGLVIAAISAVVALGTWLSNVLSEDTVEWEDLGITAAEMGEMIANGTITAEEAMETYGITEEQVTEATEAYAEAQAEAAEAAAAEAAALVEAVESMGVAEDQMVTLEQAAEMVNDGLLDASDAAEIFMLDEDALTEEIEAQAAADEMLEQAVALVEGGYLDAATAAAYFGTTVEEIETEATQEQLLNLIDVYYDLYDAAYDSIEGQFSLWDEASEVSASSLGTLQDNLESQIDYWNSYNTNLQTVSAAAAALGIDLTTVWGTLTDGSEDAVNAVAGMAEALNAGDTESFESYFDSLNKLEDAMAGVSSTIATGGETVQNAIEDVTGNAAAALWQMYQDGTITAEQCIEAYRLVSDETEEWSAAAETAESDLASAAVLVASGFMTASEAANQFGVSVSEIETVTTAIEALQTAYEEAYDAAYESISGQYSLWDEAAEQSSTSLSTLTSNVESQTAYWQDYNENLQTVAAAAEQLGLDISDLWPALTDGSEDAVNAVAGMAEALEAGDTSGFQSYIESYQKLQDAISEVSSTIAGQTEEVQAALDEFTAAIGEGLDGAELAESFSQSAADTIQGYLDGLSGSESEVSTALAEDATAWLESLNGALGVQSPSTITYDSGTNTIQGFINGIDAMVASAEAAMQNAATLALAAFTDEMGYDALYESGQNAIQGAIQGITDSLPSLIETARGAGTAAANAYKEAQDINSPSKLFAWFSEMDMQGAIEGLQESESAVNSAFAAAGEANAYSYEASAAPQIEAMAGSGDSGSVMINFSPVFNVTAANSDGVQAVLDSYTDDMRDYILQVVEEAQINKARRVYV